MVKKSIIKAVQSALNQENGLTKPTTPEKQGEVVKKMESGSSKKKQKKNKKTGAKQSNINGTSTEEHKEITEDGAKSPKKNKKVKKNQHKKGETPKANGVFSSEEQKNVALSPAKDTSTEQKMETEKLPDIGSTFSSLRPHVSSGTMEGIESFGFEKMTKVQCKTIATLLKGKDIRATAKTGSGKTLAFLIPAVENILNSKGLSCIVMSPTRELALQSYNVLQSLTKHHTDINTAIVVGGSKINSEKQPLLKANVLVATPGRLLDHLKHTKGVKVNKLKVLVIDEADRMLDDGFEKELHQILIRLPKQKRQTMLFSATTTAKLSNMTVLALKQDYEDINLSSKTDSPTDAGLTQTYLQCPTFQRVLALHKILSEQKDSKVMVFVNTCDGVNFYKKALNQLNLIVTGIHGRQGHKLRLSLFSEFCSSSKGIMLCTDIAARGWDIPAINLIVQFDPPSDVNEYIHRVGRCVRREGQTGTAVLFLRPEEIELLAVLKNKKVVLKEYEDVDMYSLDYELQNKMDELVKTDDGLKDMGIKAFRNFLTAYAILQPKSVYDNKTIPLKELSKNFGMETPPDFNFGRMPLNYVDRDLKRKAKPAHLKKGNKNKKTELKGNKKQHRNESSSKAEKLNKDKKKLKERKKKKSAEMKEAAAVNKAEGATVTTTAVEASEKPQHENDADKPKKRKLEDDSNVQAKKCEVPAKKAKVDKSEDAVKKDKKGSESRSEKKRLKKEKKNSKSVVEK